MRVKRSILQWFTAELAGNQLTPRWGSTRVVKSLAKDGELVGERRTEESHRILVANIGDRLMLFGPSLEQIAIAYVLTTDGYHYRVSLGAGAVNEGAVRVLKLRAEKKARRAVA